MEGRKFKILTEEDFDFLDRKDPDGVYDRETRETLYWTIEKLEEHLKKCTRPEKALYQRFNKANFGILFQEGTVSKGNLLHPGNVTINGHFEGDLLIHDTLILGPRALLIGKVAAGTVLSEGTIQGEVQAMVRVWLGPGAKMIGDIHTPGLEMAEGASLQGRCIMPKHGKDFTLKKKIAKEQKEPDGAKRIRFGINTWKVKVFNIK